MNGQRPLNIALLRRRLDHSGGGAEKVANRFVREFLRRGHRITFFGEEASEEARQGIEWVKIPKTGMASSPTTRFHRNVQSALEPRRHCYDIVYSMCRTYPADIFRVTEQLHAEWLPLNYPFPMQLMPRHRSILRLEKAALNPENIRHVVTNSRLIMDQVIKDYDFPAGQISRIPNGVDRSAFYPAATEEKALLRRELEWSEDQLVLLFVATKFRTKRLDLAIKAVGGLDEPLRKKLLLAVVGGDRSEPYARLAGQCGIEIRFMGKADAMRRFYAAADLLYYPSPYEPFANVCLEAAACSLPVLTTRLNGSSELVTSGMGGYVVAGIDSVAEIRSALSDYARKSGEQRRDMGATILKATEEYSWERHTDLLEQLFYRVRKEK